MQLSQLQHFNQALIQMSVLLYQVDRKVTLTEQEALDSLVESLDWQSPISCEAFKTEAIFQARKALDVGEGRAMLKNLKDDLMYDPDTAMEVAYMITGVDGERSDDEAEMLHFLTHKLLAKALTEGAVLPEE
ncbi:TerB family tellurite resistance protein [Alteromonas sediminis]|uniref:TerB family tellurite resistance protein n=1 Tax=Alteromonas sediminis TaxID=2259342 RepID=A0A3N5YF09_9ALTE|nr:TerB family tellurite resistance protein [Alteromonas sediminis]RPJ68495.1 TerB family tellurite resistance protein [Alteromonas sediminis]